MNELLYENPGRKKVMHHDTVILKRIIVRKIFKTNNQLL